MIPIRTETKWNLIFLFALDMTLGRTKMSNLKWRFKFFKNNTYCIYKIKTGDILILKTKNDVIHINSSLFEIDEHKITCKKCNTPLTTDEDIMISLESGHCKYCNKKIKLVYLNANDIRTKKIKSFL